MALLGDSHAGFRRGIAALLLAVLMTQTAPAADIVPAEAQVWMTYANDRFGFSVDVPTTGLDALPLPENGDGQGWTGQDGEVEISVFGSHWSASANDFDGYRALLRGFVLASGATLAYQPSGDTWFVHSGQLKDGRIFYDKVLALPGCDIAAHVHLAYPEAMASTFDGIVERMGRTLGPYVAAC